MEQMTKKSKGLFAEYCFLTFVILWSGSVVSYGLFNIWPYVMFVFGLIIMLKRNQKIEKTNIIAIGLLLLVLILQTVYFSGPITSIVQPILRILSIAIIAVIVRPNIIHIFVKIMAFISVVSMVFWAIDMIPVGHSALQNIANQLPQMGGDVLAEQEGAAWSFDQMRTLYVYSVSNSLDNSIYSFVRNPGPYFEPGRYSVFLTIAMALILFSGNLKKYIVAFYLIFAANITTFSTTGYFDMIVLFGCYFLGRRNSNKISNFILLIFLYISSYYVLQLDFMGEKVEMALGNTNVANSRFGAMFYHWTQIIRSPWIGYGVFLDKSYSLLEMSPCGITDMMRKWGIPMFLLFVWLLGRGTKTIITNNGFFKLSFVLILLIFAYTQTIMDAPLFYLFYFLGCEKLVYGNKAQY